MKKHALSALIAFALLSAIYLCGTHFWDLPLHDVAIGTIVAIVATATLSFLSSTSVTFPWAVWITVFISAIGLGFASPYFVVLATAVAGFTAITIIMWLDGFPGKGEKQEGVHFGNSLGVSLLEALAVFIAVCPHITW